MKILQKYRRKFYQFLERRLKKQYSDKAYCSISELPIYWWYKIHSEGDIYYLIKEKRHRRRNFIKSYAINLIWLDILDEYFSNFGFSEHLKEIVRKKKEKASYQLDIIITKNRSLQAYIDLCDNSLLELEKTIEKGDFWRIKSQIERELKFQIDIYRTTVIEYYSYLKTLSEARDGRESNIA